MPSQTSTYQRPDQPFVTGRPQPTPDAAASADTVDAADAAARADAAELARQARRLSMWARIVLVPVAIIGAVLSYQSLYKAAEPTFGPYLAAGFPLLVDLLILGASLQYVAGAKVGRPMTGWRLTAHCGVAATLILNALAAHELGEVPWHVTAPAVWAVLVELTGKQVLGQWKAAHLGPTASIAPSLWLSAPIESVRTRLLMARTGLRDAHEARIGVGTAAAAREALNLSLPRRSSARRDARRVRRVVNRQLRAGSLAPATVMDAVGWTDPEQHSSRSPESILRAVVQSILKPDGQAPTVQLAHSSTVPAAPGHRVLVLPEHEALLHNLHPGAPAAAPHPAPQPTPQTMAPTVQPTVQPTVPVAAPVDVPAAPQPTVAPETPAATTGPIPSTPVPSTQSAPWVETAPTPQPAPQPVTQPVMRRATEPTTQPIALPVNAETNPSAFTGVRDRAPIGLWAAAQARTSVPTSENPAATTPDTQSMSTVEDPSDPWGDAEDSIDERDDRYSTAISGRPTAKQKEERLSVAARIVHSRPEITGTELRAELEKEGWLVSDRTAARILTDARRMPPLSAVQA